MKTGEQTTIKPTVPTETVDVKPAQDKLFKALNPSINTLTKNKDIGAMRNNADVANQAIVDAGFKPTDTQSRMEAQATTMKQLWDNEIQPKIDASKSQVDMTKVADKIDTYLSDNP